MNNSSKNDDGSVSFQALKDITILKIEDIGAFAESLVTKQAGESFLLNDCVASLFRLEGCVRCCSDSGEGCRAFVDFTKRYAVLCSGKGDSIAYALEAVEVIGASYARLKLARPGLGGIVLTLRVVQPAPLVVDEAWLTPARGVEPDEQS